MLRLFRTYQKYVFIICAVVVSASMLFFGATSWGQGDSLRPIKDTTTVMRLPSGKTISRDQMEKMVRFITEQGLIEQREGGFPLRLHNGVIERDFLVSRWVYELADLYKEQLAQDFVGKVSEEKLFELYRHPRVPNISVRSLWEQAAPGMLVAYDHFKGSLDQEPLSRKALQARTELFLGAQQFPSNLARRILLYQQHLYAKDNPDPGLYHHDLSLFGYHNFQDWYGKRFAHLIAQTIFYFADLAELEDVAVRPKDAEVDFYYQAKHNFDKTLESPSSEANYMQYVAHSLKRQGLELAEAIDIWQTILSFRKWKRSISGDVLVDGLSIDLFQEFASKQARLQMFSLPKALQLVNAKNQEELAAYLFAVSKNPQSLRLENFAEELKPLNEIAKNYPELVEKRFSVRFKQLNLDAYANKFTVQETLKWQLEPSHWDALTKQFKELSSLSASASEEEKYQRIKGLPLEIQGDLDRLSRRLMAKENPEQISAALELEQPHEEEWVFLANGKIAHAAIRGSDLELFTRLNEANSFNYQVGENYYSIEVLENLEDRLKTFAALKKDQVLPVFAKKLMEKEPALQDKLGMEPALYANSKLKNYMEACHNDFISGGDYTKYTEGSQWSLVETDEYVSRKENRPFLDVDRVLAENEGTSSSVISSPLGDYFFYKILEIETPKKFAKGFYLQQELQQALEKKSFSEEITTLFEGDVINLDYL